MVFPRLSPLLRHSGLDPESPTTSTKVQPNRHNSIQDLFWGIKNLAIFAVRGDITAETSLRNWGDTEDQGSILGPLV